MTSKEVTEFLKSIEAKFPVDKWIIDDILIWPLVKFDIFKRWRNIEYSSYNELLENGKKKTKGFFQIQIARVSSLYKFLRLISQRNTKTPFLFIGGNSHRVNLDGKFINRYFHPLIDKFGATDLKNALILEYQSKDLNKEYGDVNPPVFIQQFYFAASLVLFFKKEKSIVQLDQFDDFLNEVELELPGLVNPTSYVQFLEKNVKEIKTYAYIFDLFFHKYSPKYAICLCYYNNFCFGMSYAAHLNHVISIDMQHGGQGVLHPAYSAFNKVPKKGFNIMPKMFWCWDKASTKVIQAWTDNQSFHEVLLGGNPWLSYFISENDQAYSFPKRKVILYTLQLKEIEPYIIQAINDSPPEFQWWLRLHPRTFTTRPRLEELLKKEIASGKVELDKATSYPLPQILKNTFIHISGTSGAVIEAAQLGVKSILIDEIGVENFTDYIENHDAIAFLDRSAESLLKLIFKIGGDDTKGEVVDSRKIFKNLLQVKVADE